MYNELDLGCGTNKHVGAIGLDMNSAVNPDVTFEFKDRRILPFFNNHFDRIWIIDFLEHIDDPQWLLSEVHRVGKPRAVVKVRYPHYSHNCAHSDITHKHRNFGLRVLDHYDPSTELGKRYKAYLNFDRNFPFKIEEFVPKYCMERTKIPRFLASLIGNRLYEDYLSSFLPIVDVSATLRVVK